MVKFLRSLDKFGQPISFYIKGKSTYTTYFGGIITAIISIVMIYIGINSFINLINRVNMISTTETIHELNSPYLDLTQQNFMFSLGIIDKTITLNNSILSFNAYLVTANTTSSIFSWTQIALRPCQQKDYNSSDNAFNTYIGNLLCPDNFSYPIYNSLNNPVYQSINIFIESCVNGTNPYVTCASQEFINNYIQNSPVTLAELYFINNVLDFQNQKNPYKNFEGREYISVDLSNSLIYSSRLSFRSNQISSFDDIFGISSPNTYNFITYQNEKQDLIFPEVQNSSVYAEVRLLSSNYRNYYTRSYDDIMSTLSYIGGIYSLITTFAGYIVTIYNSYKYKMKMFNELYDFELKEPNTPADNNENYENKLRTMNISTSNKTHTETQLDDPIIKEQFDKIKRLRKRLNFTIRECLYSVLCYCRAKVVKAKIILFDIANNKLIQDMDIIWLIKKIREFDKLKMILLYPDKLKIFDFIPPPIISIDNHKENQVDIPKSSRRKTRIKKKIASLKESKNISQNLDEYYKYSHIYTNIKNGNDIIGQNLINCLDPDIANIFECIEDTKNSLSLFRLTNKTDEFQRNLEISKGFKINQIKHNTQTKPMNQFTLLPQDAPIQLENTVDNTNETSQYKLQYQQLTNFNSLNMPKQD